MHLRFAVWIAMGMLLVVFVGGSMLYHDNVYPFRMEPARVVHPTYIVASEHGQIRSGVFVRTGTREVIELGKWAIRRQERPKKCGQSKGWIQSALQRFRIPEVHAVSCQSGYCESPGYVGDLADCPLRCGIQFERFAWDPAVPTGGWKYTGGGTCPANDNSGFCRCEAAPCP